MTDYLRVKLFGAFAEAAAKDDFDFKLPSEATVASLWDALCAEFAELPSISIQRLCAVNEEFAPADRVLAAGDIVAFFPPVSGG
ncbi:MoaD/ThiS family protein [bacterium]|nr:MoaD/ThiS family protein [bacterium]